MYDRGVSIEATAHGTYRARWRDESGKQRAKTFKRKSHAVSHLKTIHGDLHRGEYVDPHLGRITVDKLADEWLAGAMNLRAGGRETYRRDLDRYIIPALGQLRVSALTPTAIDEYLSGELERGLAPSSVHRHYRTLRRMLQVAVIKGRLKRNPCDPVTPPHIPPSEMRFLTVDQVEALAATITPRYRAWVYGSVYVGWRWSEGVGLQRMRIDGQRVTIADELVRRADKAWHRDEPKTRAGRRVVTAPAFAADVLAEHLELWALEGPTGLVFPNRAGHPLIGSSFTGNVFKPALVRAGIDREVRIHDLRHTAVALAIAAGAHPKAIQARMGHASITVTLDRYGHLFPEMDETIAAGLNDLRRGVAKDLAPVDGDAPMI